jgi:cytochrome c553
VAACTLCHGKEGVAGPDGYYPRIAGKPAGYLYQQLLNFREGRRRYAPMAGLLQPLSNEYLMDIARYFAALELPYAAPSVAPPRAPALLTRGRALALEGDPARQLPACARCHGEALTGRQPAIPGLLGLPRDYLTAQLGAWQTGQRRGRVPDCMAEIVRRLDASDAAAVAGWLSRQPVPAQPRAVEMGATRLPLRCGSVEARCAPGGIAGSG